MDHPNDDDECLDVRLARSFVQEVQILHEFVAVVKESRGETESASFKKIQALIEKYQEQGQLLEPHLEGIISPLMETLQMRVAEAGNVRDVDLNVVKKLCSIVHTLMTVCGYKTVVKFFPHQACDLEVTVSLLERCHEEVTVSSILKEESTGEWETKCTLLLWLSILVLIPFDMVSVDTSLADHTDSSTDNCPELIPPLVERMIVICKEYLGSPGPVREMAGVLLSRLLTRPDMRSALKIFVAWSREALGNTQDGVANVFLVPGIVGVLAAIFKVGGRDILLDSTLPVWEAAVQLASSSAGSRSPLLRKLLIKLMQRISLMHLPPRVATWRYMQNSGSLAQNLVSPSSEVGREAAETQNKENLCQEEVMEGEIDVPEIIEEVIEQLLNCLRDKDTVVRWSAAKGIGLVTGRLSLTLADEVVASVLELFRPSEGDGAWHGGCLALAELARRGLLLPARLSTVVPVVIKALHYDVRKGPHSVGSHVRDAAAYVSWAFARAYSSALMKDHFKQLAPALLTIACYDREVNCRRAAAAAFQESVGRQGDFEHGIDIVNAADYFSLGTRTHAYCVVAVYIAQFEEYRIPLIQELLKSKVCHWEKSLRELAAEALSLLVKYDAPYFEGVVLETLAPWTLSADLCQRHGATLAMAEVIRVLHDCKCRLTPEKECLIAGIVPAIEKARLYRGKGGEIMRAAVSRVIECTSIVQVPLIPRIQKVFHDSIDENLKHPNADIQACAVAALKSFIHGYLLPVTVPAISRTTVKYVQILKSDANPAAQRGSALALGALPIELLAPMWKDVVDVLCAATMLKANPADDDAETRVNAVRGLTCVCETLCTPAAHDYLLSACPDPGSPLLVVKIQVMKTLFNALNDYAIDNRGDVGSWVREAAMEGVEGCTYLLCQGPTSSYKELIEQESRRNDGMDSDGHCRLFDEDIGIQVIGGLAKQAVEKIDRVRDVAGRALQRLLHCSQISVPCIPHKTELEQVIPDDTNLNWAAPGVSFPRLVQFLRFPEYRHFLLSGLVIAIGGLADSLGKVSGTALVEFLQNAHNLKMGYGSEQNEANNVDWLAVELGHVLVRYAGNDRGVVPTLKTIDILFSRGIFSSLQPLGDVVAGELLSLVRYELRGCKDVTKLLVGISVLSHIASLRGPVRDQSIEQLLYLLFHRYPKVRKVCAEQLYLLLLQIGEELIEIDVEVALEVIGETCWDGPIEGIAADRDQLYGIFHVEPPPRQILLASKSKENRPRVPSLRDENESYSSLVDAAGY